MRRWQPWMLEHGVHPWDLARYTLGEYRQLVEHHDALRRAEEAM